MGVKMLTLTQIIENLCHSHQANFNLTESHTNSDKQ